MLSKENLQGFFCYKILKEINMNMIDILSQIKLDSYKEEELDITLSAYEVFKRMYASFDTVFLLESLGEEGKYNRYSYIGFNPLLTFLAKGKELIIGRKSYKTENPFQTLAQFGKNIQKQLKSSPKNGFCGGLVGYLSHEATAYFDSAFVGCKNYDFPDFAFGLYVDGLKYDKKLHKFTYFHFGKSRLKQIYSSLFQGGNLTSFSFKKLATNKSEKEHREMVESALEHIRAGDIFQIVLSVKTNYQIAGDMRKLYAVLRQINPSPYMFFLKFDDKEVISASPELLIQVNGREIEHFGTLAGTIRRGKGMAADSDLARQLLSDEKEKAEHMMLVDLARNDIGRICEFGTIRVEKLLSIKKYSHVQHLYSEVKGTLRPGENSFTALASCFPAGTLTGAPKIEAMKLIAQLEGEARGPYGGVGGYISLNGDCMLAITIRSLFRNGEHAYTQTGSGIVLDSIPKKEYQEIINKQKAIDEALRLASARSG